MLPIYSVSLKGKLTAISLVNHPAIEENFQAFNEMKELKMAYDEEKHIVFGPAIIPDKPIYRRDSNGREYYVVFTKDVIEGLFSNFMKNEAFNFDLEHSNKTANVFLLEAFIKRPGLNPVGYEDLPDGSMFISLKVEDDDLWNSIKSGEFNGFSIECFVDLEPVDEMELLINELLE